MKKNILILSLGLVILLGVVFFIYNSQSEVKDYSNVKIEENGESMENKMAEETVRISGNYFEFSQSEYQKALSDNKKIMLYFYANWCPTCKAEQPATIEAFSELNNDEIIGFRVNYKDSDTDDYEEQLAKEFGITYQHTKVLIVNGKEKSRSLESWNKDKYLEELNRL